MDDNESRTGGTASERTDAVESVMMDKWRGVGVDVWRAVDVSQVQMTPAPSVLSNVKRD